MTDSLVVYSDPEGERGNQRPDQVTEMVLAGRDIERLRGFEPFVNLSALFLENNKLMRVRHLEGLFRLRYLSLHHNEITSLGCLDQLTFLEVLLLHDNKIYDAAAVSSKLSSLSHLKELTLFNNPVEEEFNYRLSVLGKLPWLEVFDRCAVKNEEAQAAEMTFGDARGSNRRPATVRPPFGSGQPRNTLSGMLPQRPTTSGSLAGSAFSLTSRRTRPRTSTTSMTHQKSTLRTVRTARTVSSRINHGDRTDLATGAQRLRRDVSLIKLRRTQEEESRMESMFTNHYDPVPKEAPLPKSLDFLGQQRQQEEETAKRTPREHEEKKNTHTPFIYSVNYLVLPSAVGSKPADNKSAGKSNLTETVRQRQQLTERPQLVKSAVHLRY